MRILQLQNTPSRQDVLKTIFTLLKSKQLVTAKGPELHDSIRTQEDVVTMLRTLLNGLSPTETPQLSRMLSLNTVRGLLAKNEKVKNITTTASFCEATAKVIWRLNIYYVPKRFSYVQRSSNRDGAYNLQLSKASEKATKQTVLKSQVYLLFSSKTGSLLRVGLNSDINMHTPPDMFRTFRPSSYALPPNSFPRLNQGMPSTIMSNGWEASFIEGTLAKAQRLLPPQSLTGLKALHIQDFNDTHTELSPLLTQVTGLDIPNSFEKNQALNVIYNLVGSSNLNEEILAHAINSFLMLGCILPKASYESFETAAGNTFLEVEESAHTAPDTLNDEDLINSYSIDLSDKVSVHDHQVDASVYQQVAHDLVTQTSR